MNQKRLGKIGIALLIVGIVCVIALIGGQLAKRAGQPSGSQITPTPTATSTPVPTNTPVPMNTPEPTATTAPIATNIPTPTSVPQETLTPVPTNTPVPMSAPQETLTPVPTNTLIPTNTPEPTATSTPVPTNTPVPTEVPEPVAKRVTGSLTEGMNVFIYSVAAKGVLADQTSTTRINATSSEVTGDVLRAGNGARVFTVEKNGEYYRFYNETDGYLCANGTGNNAFYSKTASKEADWTLEAGNGGYYLQNRVAKYRDTYPQYLEYYSSLITTYSMNNVRDYDIYTFYFYATESAADVVNKPQISTGRLASAKVGMDYELKFQIEAMYGVKELSVAVEGTELVYSLADGVCRAIIPAELIKGSRILASVAGMDEKNTAFSAEITVEVMDVPLFVKQTPSKSAQTGAEKQPVISVDVINVGENPSVIMTVAGKQVKAEYADGRIVYVPETALADGRTEVTVKLTRSDGVSAETSWKFTVGEASYELFYGQLHSHTEYSDGSGSLESALDYILNLPDSANVDFVAFTDHSNYFDKSGAANPEGALYDLSLATSYSQNLWTEFTRTIDEFNAKQNEVLAIGGFEMTWSGGPGHINTFNTEGIVSRNNTTLNNKAGNAGLQAYYALLSEEEGVDSISQFNHPGAMFGTFIDFAYWDAQIDERVHLIEVANGSGMVGANGYYPSYEAYNMALDKGWHLAPTMNQDNHGGRWGNSNEARDVVLAEDLTEESIYDAIRNYRAYATEDRNLELYYTVNDLPLGSIITELPEEVNIRVQLHDPDAYDTITKVEVIANAGKTVYAWTDAEELAQGMLTVTLEPNYTYYYIRVTQADGNLAFTAPVWIEAVSNVGASSLECVSQFPMIHQEAALKLTLFNNEYEAATVKNIILTLNGDSVIAVDTTKYVIPGQGTTSVELKYTPEIAQILSITATVVIEQGGVEYTHTAEMELDVH